MKDKLLKIFKNNEKEVIAKIMTITILTIISVICYLPLVANNLTNTFDGLWQSTYFKAEKWELSIGRWAWVLFDRLKGGYAAQPYIAILSLVCLSSGMVIVLSIFGWKRYYLLYSCIFIISTTACCYLSYSYMAYVFGLAFFLSILSTRMLMQTYESNAKNIINCFIAIIFLTISIGLYQADLGCFCLVIIVYAMNLLLHTKRRDAIIFLVRGVIVAGVGCILYKAVWDILLNIYGVSASGYKGADSLSILELLLNVPTGIAYAYKAFYKFFSPFSGYGYYIFRKGRTIIILVFLLLVIIKGIRTLRNDIISLIIYLVLFSLVPLASNVFFLLTTGTEELLLQMTGALALVIPLLLVLTDANYESLGKLLLSFMGIIILYGNIIAVGTDIDAMRQGTKSSEAIINNVNVSLIQEELFDSDYKYCFVGRISDNPLFKKNKLWDNANEYAQVGKYYPSKDGMSYSYIGLLEQVGVNLSVVNPTMYEQIVNNEDYIKNMPVYPKKGSIIKDGTNVIIKMSDAY